MSDLTEGRISNSRRRVAQQSTAVESAARCAGEDSLLANSLEGDDQPECCDDHPDSHDAVSSSAAELPVPTTWRQTLAEVLSVAFPLMISTGMMSIVLFADRYLLGRYDGVSMGASMAGGNLFWVLVCVPIGAAP